MLTTKESRRLACQDLNKMILIMGISGRVPETVLRLKEIRETFLGVLIERRLLQAQAETLDKTCLGLQQLVKTDGELISMVLADNDKLRRGADSFSKFVGLLHKGMFKTIELQNAEIAKLRGEPSEETGIFIHNSQREAFLKQEAARLGYTLVPSAALDFLNGEGPDPEGNWFGSASGRRPYWWRTALRDMIKDGPGAWKKRKSGSRRTK
jgi:hypothetical protein